MIKKDKIKEELIKQFNNEFPESPLESMAESDLSDVNNWISTGNFSLNWIISKSIFKGLPMGRVVLFSGDPQSGKSLIALSMMREPSIDYIIYFDSEGGGVTRDFANFIGIDPNKVLYAPVDTVEGMIERFRKIIDTLEKNKTHKNILLIIDSISMLSTERELNPDKGQDMGTRARLTRSFFRQYIRKMQKLNICAVFTAHLTQNIGGYGPTKVVAGGSILGYAPSVEIRFSRVNSDSDIEKSAIGAKMVKIRAEVQKSRFGTTNKRVKFDLDMEKGLDPYAGLFDILSDYEFIIKASKDLDKQIKEKKIPKKSSGWYIFKPFDNELTTSLHKRIIKEKLTSEGKFRESKIKEWCDKYLWFLEKIEKLLQTIYKDEKNEKKEKKEEKSTITITDISSETNVPEE